MNHLNIANLPKSLISIARWMLYVLLADTPDAKPRKVPVDPNTLHYGNRPEHCASFEFVLDTYRHARPMPDMEPPVSAPEFAGLGFHFEYDEIAPLIFIDLDNCFDPATGDPMPWAEAIVEHLDSYTEFSRSGNGLHILLRSSRPPEGRCRTGNIEIYWRGRWAAMTGLHVEGTPTDLEDRTAELLALHNLLFPAVTSRAAVRSKGHALLADEDVLRRARAARNGPRFQQLYDEPPARANHSEEDLELCGILAFWTGRDPVQIDHLFRGSQLMREKWLRESYRVPTIRKAIENCKRSFGEFPSIPTGNEKNNG